MERKYNAVLVLHELLRGQRVTIGDYVFEWDRMRQDLVIVVTDDAGSERFPPFDIPISDFVKRCNELEEGERIRLTKGQNDAEQG